MNFRSRSLLVLCAAALLAVAGVVFGLVEAFVLAAGAAGILVASTVRTLVQRPGLEIRRSVTSTRCAVGEVCVVELQVTNRSRRPSPASVLTDNLGARGSTTVRLAPLEPFASVTSTYPAPTERRGLIHLGPLSAATIDPFGLTERRIECDTGDTVIAVWPRSWLLPGIDAGGTSGGDRRVPVGSAQHFGRGDEFSSLHEYTPGDDVRQIHWPSTARLGRPIIKQNEPPKELRSTIIVDARITDGDPQAFERTLSLAASLIRSATDRIITVLVAGADSSPSPVHQLVTASPSGVEGRSDGGATRTEFLLDHLCLLGQAKLRDDTTEHGTPAVIDICDVTGDEVVLVTPRSFSNINDPDDSILFAAEGRLEGLVASTSSTSAATHTASSAPSWLTRFETLRWDGTESLTAVWELAGRGRKRTTSSLSGHAPTGLQGR